MIKTRAIFAVTIFVLAFHLTALCQQPSEESRQKRRISLPSKDWALELEVPVTSRVFEYISEDGRERSYSVWPEGKFDLPPSMIWVRLMSAEAAGGGSAFREVETQRLHKSQRVPKNEIKLSEYNQIAVASYKFNDFSYITGMVGLTALRHDIKLGRAMAAYLAKDDVWIHLVVNGRSDKEIEKRFYPLLDSVRIVNTSTPASSFDHYEKGRTLYMAKEFGKALDFYAKALELERRERRLDMESWRNLVYVVAEITARKGEVGKAKEVIEYGLAEDPTNPIFHYFLAQIHSFNGDMENTIASLERAFQNKKNFPVLNLLWPMRIIPDPARDPAFERFRKDERFRKAIRGMK